MVAIKIPYACKLLMQLSILAMLVFSFVANKLAQKGASIHEHRATVATHRDVKSLINYS